MTEKILAWHGSAELKAEVLARLEAHRQADDFIRGAYQRKTPNSPLGYKGCALGCTLPAQKFYTNGEGYIAAAGTQERESRAWHDAIEEYYGIPADVAALIDEIFESLDEKEEAAQFAQDVAAAIPVGADLSWIARRVEDYDADYARASAEALISNLSAAPVPGLKGA